MLAADDNVTDKTATSQSRNNMVVGTAHGQTLFPPLGNPIRSVISLDPKKTHLWGTCSRPPVG
jgi:hypothetical protein